MADEKKNKPTKSETPSKPKEETKSEGWAASPEVLDILSKMYQERMRHVTGEYAKKWLVENLGNRYEGILLHQSLARPHIDELEAQITKLKTEIDSKARALLEQTVDAQQKENQIGELKNQLQSLQEKERLSHLLTRVGPAAQQKLLDSTEFRARFDRDTPSSAYVLSIDIRRSTELMLKARDPKLFAEFLLSLARQLRDVVLENYGIFDKFTGDGILAFFPEFYSGKDAGYFALSAATMCHQLFATHYYKHKHCFVSILKETGLGIGLDYGSVQIVQLPGDFTVVGTPVVYACRMAGADAGHTYLNQPAFEQLFERYSSVCDFDECEINIKHEGKTLAYSAELNGKSYSATLPDWHTPAPPVETTGSGRTSK